MKKYILLPFIVLLSSCSVDSKAVRTVDTSILNPITGLRYKVSLYISVMFFSKAGVVYIENLDEGNNKNNNYYLLTAGEQEINSSVVSFRLIGQGVNVGNYIGIFFEPGVAPKLGIAVEETRELAINAARSVVQFSGDMSLAKGQEVLSPILFFLNGMSPLIVDDGTKLSTTVVKELTQDSGAVSHLDVGEVLEVVYRPTTPSIDPKRLDFETNISETISIFKFQDNSAAPVVTKLWGAKVDFTNYRLQIVTSAPVSSDPTLDELRDFGNKIERTSSYEYNFK